jgi:hypothetical protein
MTVKLDNTKQDFDFFKWTMPESRKADFYLGCLDSCVFLDFNLTTDKRINLCRISFDGYGCCNIDNAKCLDEQASKDFINEIGRDNLNQEKITKYVLELVRLNKDNIWKDALEEYNLIDNE